MLNTVGINLDDCFKANVFSQQPTDNNLLLYCTDDPQSRDRSRGPLVSNPLAYMDRAHAGELARLYTEVALCSPNIIIALGNTACWALNLGTGINKLRGNIYPVEIPSLSHPIKVLPTYHPAAVLRQWSQRVIAIADLQKAHNEAHSRTISFDNTELWLNPTLEDLLGFDTLYMESATVCAADIETRRGQITCISFSPRTSVSLAIPFWLKEPDTNYWTSLNEECQAWEYVRRWMERDDLIKVFQNGLFDLQYLQHHCSPQACTEDTMLLHHSLYSELRKGLGFLGSIYANVPSWKQMATFKKEEQLKADD